MHEVCLYWFVQQRLKEEKEAKRTLLDSRHQFLFGNVATKLQMEESKVEDFVLEGDQVRSICHGTLNCIYHVRISQPLNGNTINSLVISFVRNRILELYMKSSKYPL